MSVVTPVMRNNRRPLVATCLCLVAIGILWAPPPRQGSAGPGPGAAGGLLAQSPWVVRAHPAPASTGITRAVRDVFQKERTEVVGRIQSLYDALFLQPDRRRPVVAEMLSEPASRALASSRVGLHDKVQAVRTTKRIVKVGIQSDDGVRAAAVVLVQASAVRGEERVEVWHRAHLWLEKENGKWNVVGFDAEQGRLP